MTRSTSGFLSPYRVIDLTDVRGMLAGQMLAKLGADVIQVEAPGEPHGGPHDASMFQRSAYVAGKRAITLDLDQPAGRELLHRLLETADILIESADHGVMARRGLDHRSLAARHPRLIHVSITAFGSSGPKAGLPATDLTVWAAGGPLLQTRNGDQAPLRISAPQAFHHAAADGAGGAMVALFARKLTGRGQHVDVAAAQSAAQSTLSSVLSAAVGHESYSLRPAPKSGTKKPLDLSGSGARTRRTKWPVKDGLVELHLAMGPATGRFTNHLFAWMHEAGAIDARIAAWDWMTIPQKVESDEITDEELDAVRITVGEFLLRFTKQELTEQAIKRKLLIAPVMTVADIVASPHYAARGYFREVTEEDGARRLLPGPYAIVHAESDAFVPERGAPRRGSDNSRIYGEELGIPASELASLAQQAVI